MKYLVLLLLFVSTAASADAFQPWVRRDQRQDYIGAASDSKPITNVKRGAKLIEYNTGKSYRWKGSEERGATTDWYELYDPVSLGTRLAGERNEDSTTGTDYLSTSGECKGTTFDTATNSSTEYNGPALLEWVYVNTVLSAHTVVLKDNTTAKITLPASMAAGAYLPVPGMRFDTNFTVDPDDASTGNITYCIRPLDSSQVTY